MNLTEQRAPNPLGADGESRCFTFLSQFDFFTQQTVACHIYASYPMLTARPSVPLRNLRLYP